MGAYGLAREENVDLLVRTALEYGVTDRRQISYILATAQHESDNFKTSREYDGPNQAVRNGYRGGANYYGRGYVQVTHDDRYDAMADVFGDPRIREKPDILAQDAALGAQTTVVGMVRGLFTGVGIDRYINADRTDYLAARAIVNGNDRAGLIAGYARTWEARVEEVIDRVSRGGLTPRVMPGSPMEDGSLSRGEIGPEVRQLQKGLVRDGASISPDGSFGIGTRSAVMEYQRRHGFPATGVASRAMLEALGVEPQHGQPVPSGASFSSQRLTEPVTGGDLLERIRDGVRELDRWAGKGWDDNSERLSISLLVKAVEQGFTERDDVKVAFNVPTDTFSQGEIVHLFRQGEGASPDPAANRAHVRTADALSMPVSESLRQAESLTRSFAQAQQIGPPNEIQRLHAEHLMRM